MYYDFIINNFTTGAKNFLMMASGNTPEEALLNAKQLIEIRLDGIGEMPIFEKLSRLHRCSIQPSPFQPEPCEICGKRKDFQKTTGKHICPEHLV